MAPIAVRQILLSAFLVHILLPLLPRLISLVSSPPVVSNDQKPRGPGATDFPRLLQMSLVLSTQARYTSFYPTRDFLEGEARDEDTRDGVEELSRAVRWSMAVASGALQLPPEDDGDDDDDDVPDSYTAQGTATGSVKTPVRPGLQRGPSVSQAGRLRLKGPRDRAGSISQLEPELQGRQLSHGTLPPEQRWGRPRIDEDDDEMLAPSTEYHGVGVVPAMNRRSSGQSAHVHPAGLFPASTSTAQSTVRAAESFATLTDRTPGANPNDLRRHARHERALSSGESDLTNASSSIFSKRHKY